MAVRIGSDEVLAEIKDDVLDEYFAGADLAEFVPEYIEENKKRIRIPVSYTHLDVYKRQPL